MFSNFFAQRVWAGRAYRIGSSIVTFIMIGTFLGIHPFRYGLYEGRALLRMTFILVGNGDSALSFLSNAMYSVLPLVILGSVTINQMNDQKNGLDVAVIARLGRKKQLQQLYIGSGILGGVLFLLPLLLNHLFILLTKLIVGKTYSDNLNAEVIMPLGADPIWHWGVWSWQHLAITDLLYGLGNAWIFILLSTLLVSLGLIIPKLYQLVLVALALYLPFWGGPLSVNQLMQPIIPAYLHNIVWGYLSLTLIICVINFLVYRFFSKQVVS